MQKLKHIVILATGGTIAGRADSALQMTGYQAGALSVQALLASAPGLEDAAVISAEQLCNIGSQNMTDALLLKLARRCNELLARADVDGIVVTHGTDTMEETAYFLHLTVKSAKPVVLTGAMRPATAVSADGPLNLINAVKTAADDASVGQGALVVMNDEIYGARDVSKTNTMSTAAFKAPSGAPLGVIVGGRPVYGYAPLRLHTTVAEFAVDALSELPRVDIIYTHINEDRVLVDAVVRAGAQGIVYAGSGMGSVHEAAEPALAEAAGRGIVVVRSSRVGGGMVTAGLVQWTRAGFLNGDSLNPQKARILLQLALTRTRDRDAIQEMFDKY